MKKPLAAQISETKLALSRALPRSRRHAELELRLRDLMLIALRRSNREERRAA